MGTRDERGFTFAVEPGVEAAGPRSYGKDGSRMRERRARAPSTIAEAWQTFGR
eukprot:SAG31_NODE_6120_length_2160_cov_4.003396_2_plen_53_part_00